MSFEYKTAVLATIDDAKLNAYGADGWELAVMYPGVSESIVFVFKKAKKAKTHHE